MENITLGQIAVAIAFLAALITGTGVLLKTIKKWLGVAFQGEFDKLNKKMDGLQTYIDDVRFNSCKNYLVHFLSEVDRGQPIDEIERERFWEQYEHYKKNGGNSYIKRKVEQLTHDGKL